jgi:hypothetical protein
MPKASLDRQLGQSTAPGEGDKKMEGHMTFYLKEFQQSVLGMVHSM